MKYINTRSPASLYTVASNAYQVRTHAVLLVCGVISIVAYILFTPISHASCEPDAMSLARYGTSGEQVRTLQTCLVNAGYSIPAGITGYYGVQTRYAVRAFYARAMDIPDWHGNAVGPQGRALLARTETGAVQEVPPTQTQATQATASCADVALSNAVYGARHGDVSTLQQCLMRAGYSIPAGVTGYYGAQTRDAVRAFYADVLQLPGWHGNSIGPVGRSALASRVDTKKPVAVVSSPEGYRTARDADDLARYISAERSYAGSFSGRTTIDVAMPTVPMIGAPSMVAQESSARTPSRVSTTNVQVMGIDEPDMVKTDGTHLYVSNVGQGYRWFDSMPMPMLAPESDEVATSRRIAPPHFEQPPTYIMQAFPPEDLKTVSDTIREAGDMLLVQNEDILIIFSYPSLVAYDVSAPDAPHKVWDIDLKNNTRIVTARLLDGTVYLITQTSMGSGRPCPIVPLARGGLDVQVSCGSILVPDRVEPASHLYTALAINPKTGATDRQVSWAGEGADTTVSMFEDNLYVASRSYNPQFRVLADLMIETLTPHLPAQAITRARTIQTYDISEAGKLTEIEKLLQAELARFTPDERLRIENEAANAFQDGLKAKMRDMYRTRIVRIPLSTLTIAASGEVPGYLLNQFAMDEHNGNLRVAVTIEDQWRGVESANDIYVLNSTLSVIGSVQGLGLTERVYAVRFMGDKGYVVTFRQIDPFYVLDLRTPTNPRVTGELKIPGYSAYLELLGNDLVLGVGREGNGVKLSIFDVRNPARPVEKAKYQLSDAWTEVESNHHAFLRDADNEMFFIPGGEGGYVFSYKGGALTLSKAFAGYGIKRAVYIDDYFYVVSEDTVRVFDIQTWEEVTEKKYR